MDIQAHGVPREKRSSRVSAKLIAGIALTAMVIAAVLFWWWSLGYRAENCHEDDMGRGQQWICDILEPNNR